MSMSSSDDFAAGAPATGSARTVTAFFDTRSAAQKAIDDLVGAGVSRDRVTMIEGGSEPVEAPAIPSSEKGFWATLRDLFMPDEDRHSYGEGLRRGGFLLAVRDDGPQHDAIVDILDREGTVNMDERETQWRSEGWDPSRAGRDLASETSFGRSIDAAPAPLERVTPPTAQMGLGATVPTDELREAYRDSPEAPAVPAADDIPPDEAAPGRTGKRDSDLGRPRVRSYLDDGL